MPFSLLWAAVRGHRRSLLIAYVLLVAWSGALRLSPIVTAAALAVALVGWWTLEVPAMRRLGAREPSIRERTRLDRVNWTLLMRDEPSVTIRRGLRALQVSTGTLETFDDDQLAALLTHESARLAAGDAIAPALAWLGALPFAVGWCLTRGVLVLSRLLAASCATALVVPALVCPAWWTTWVGRLFAFWVTLVLGLWLIDVGLQTHSAAWVGSGLAFLSGWFVTPLIASLIARDARRAELAADQVVIEAGLAEPLVSALELLAAVDAAAPFGLWPTLFRDRTPIEERIQALQR